MNKTTVFRLILGLFIVPLAALLLVLTPGEALAQDTGYPAESEKFSREELAQMLGPIALYPDKLLSQVLMASTYPIEVIEADRWIKNNPGLQSDLLDRALLDKEWDPSVKAICHFPAILALMSERITETTDLGNAFLGQEAEVMAMVQELRNRAYDQGNLVTTSQQKVVVEKETIVIEPANPWVVYAPYYDPYYIYGPWWYPAYPPRYWGPPGISLGVRFAFWPGIYFGFSWGDWCYFDWPHLSIYINAHERPRFVRHDRWLAQSGHWHHAPVHRRGVAYRDNFTATKYGQDSRHYGDVRSDPRGLPERREPAQAGSRSGDERNRIDRGRRGDHRDNYSRYEGSQQDQQRIERELQKRHEPSVRDRQPRRIQPKIGEFPQERARVEQQRQERPRIDRAPRERQQQQLNKQSTVRDRQPRQEPPRVGRVSQEGSRALPQRQERPQIDRIPQERAQAEQQRQEAPRIDRAPRERERVERERPLRQRADQERRIQPSVERERPQRNRAGGDKRGDGDDSGLNR